jgi:hypothetical protein
LVNCFLGPIGAQIVAKAASDYAGATQQAAAFVEEDAFNATMFRTPGGIRQNPHANLGTWLELSRDY